MTREHQAIPHNYQLVVDEKIYRVNSYGQIFQRCQFIGTAQVEYQFMWHFNSLDTETLNYQFYTFKKDAFTEAKTNV